VSFNTSSCLSAASTTHETPDAWQEVFQKTLALFCAVQESGCPFHADEASELSSSSDEDEELESLDTPPAQNLYEVLRDGRALEQDPKKCQGRICFSRDRYHRPFLQ
jgi:hypothetical protein